MVHPLTNALSGVVCVCMCAHECEHTQLTSLPSGARALLCTPRLLTC